MLKASQQVQLLDAVGGGDKLGSNVLNAQQLMQGSA